MGQLSPALALFAVMVLILGVTFLRPAGPDAPKASLQSASVPDADPSPSSPPSPSPSPAPSAATARPNATPIGSADAQADKARDANASAPGARSAAQNATGNATNVTTNATPRFHESNASVTWNTTLGSSSSSCVPAFGVPVCAPGAGSGGVTKRVKPLGARDVARGNLTFTWRDPNGNGNFAGGAGLRASLVAGTGCDETGCASERDLNVTGASGSSPLRLGVPALDLAANETLVLVLEETCNSSLGGGGCGASSIDVGVTGWLVRLVPDEG